MFTGREGLTAQEIPIENGVLSPAIGPDRCRQDRPQLEAKLEYRKGSVENPVVDHLERPSEN